jgi:hypothetical protein
MSRIIRDIFTGELKEVESGRGGRQIIARTTVPEHMEAANRRTGSAWARTFRGQSLAVHPDQAAAFSEAAQEAGTGAWYDEKGHLCADSEGALQREMGRRGFYDKEATFSDQSRARYDEYEARAIEEVPYNRSPLWGF